MAKTKTAKKAATTRTESGETQERQDASEAQATTAERAQGSEGGDQIPEAVLSADNSALDADYEAQSKAGEDAVDDEFEETGSLKVSAEALDPTKVQQVGSSTGLATGDRVSITLANGRQVRANVMGVHPGVAENKAAGIPAIEPTVDVKAETGNPDKGGWEELYGIPLSTVRAEAQFR